MLSKKVPCTSPLFHPVTYHGAALMRFLYCTIIQNLQTSCLMSYYLYLQLLCQYGSHSCKYVILRIIILLPVPKEAFFSWIFYQSRQVRIIIIEAFPSISKKALDCHNKYLMPSASGGIFEPLVKSLLVTLSSHYYFRFLHRNNLAAFGLNPAICSKEN